MNDKLMTYCDWCDISVCPLCHWPNQEPENYKDSIYCEKHDPDSGYKGFLSHEYHDKRHCCCKK